MSNRCRVFHSDAEKFPPMGLCGGNYSFEPLDQPLRSHKQLIGEDCLIYIVRRVCPLRLNVILRKLDLQKTS